MAGEKNFDSEFCGSLPLHHINSIQDYGWLLVLDKRNLSIIQGSENLAGVFTETMQELIGSAISSYLPADEVDQLQQLINRGVNVKVPMMLTFNVSATADRFHALIHIKPGYVIIEVEKVHKMGVRSFTEVFQEVKYISAAIDQAETVQEVCTIAIHELKKLSGFDGVLMYHFDEHWNGTVIAEEKDERLERYISQTFPASDVPKQARALYLKNPYRLIPNREYQPVRLYPVINPLTNAFIDLSDCNLRAVAGVHLEYMKNMDVMASMSIRVIHNEKLWGLISCHHLDTKYLNYELCSIFEWLSDVISARITMILNKQDYQLTKQLQLKRLAITDRIYGEDNIISGLLKDDEQDILDLFKATGAVVSLNGRMETKGQVPPKDALDNLMLWLEGKGHDQIFSTHHVADLYDDGAEFAAVVSGLLVIPVDSSKGDFVVCFRPEVIEDINWGGDPNHAVNFDKDGKNYHPRNSFKLWKQTVREQALPWSKYELEVAESLRSFLFEFRTKQLQN